MGKDAQQVTLTFRPQPHQVIPDISTALTLMAQTGRGTGKTWNGCRWLLTNALRYPGTTWVACAQTWRDAQRILAEGEGGLRWHIMGDEATGRPNLEFTLRNGAWGGAFVRSPGAMALYFANGSTILFASADVPDSLRGLNAAGALADEVAFWPAESFDMLRMGVRSRLPDGTPPRIFCATTPDGENWLWQRFFNPEKLPRPDVAFIGGAAGGTLPPDPPPSTFDNRYTDQMWREQLLAMYEGTDLAAQEIYGQIISRTGAIFPRLSVQHTRAGLRDSSYVWPTPDDADEIVAGQDLGAENPSALVVMARKGERWHAVAEVYAPAATEEAWWQSIKDTIAEWKPGRIYSDRNFPQTTNAQTARGLPVVLADKRPESVVDGIRVIQQAVYAETIIIDGAACPNLLREMRNYRWQTRADGSPMLPERPVKKDDHAVDALRYMMFMTEGRPRRRLTIAG